MRSYDARTRERMIELGTEFREWRGLASRIGEDGLPVAELPAGYRPAPTLGESSGDCCELCGAQIKNAFWALHDGKKWILRIGSECATRFGDGRSGVELAKDRADDEGRELLRRVILARKALWGAYARTDGFGSRVRSISRAVHGAELALHLEMKEIVGRTDPESASRGSITRWVRANADRARELIARAEERAARATR